MGTGGVQLVVLRKRAVERNGRIFQRSQPDTDLVDGPFLRHEGEEVHVVVVVHGGDDRMTHLGNRGVRNPVRADRLGCPRTRQRRKCSQ